LDETPPVNDAILLFPTPVSEAALIQLAIPADEVCEGINQALVGNVAIGSGSLVGFRRIDCGTCRGR
jgi:hypothetical protein